MNKSESKYYNTAVRMDEALLALLAEKDLSFITVKEICQLAEVNRSTFYLHYETIGDLLDECFEHMNRRFLEYFPKTSDFVGRIQTAPIEDLYLVTPEYLLPYLRYARENRRLYELALERPEALNSSGQLAGMLGAIIGPIMDRLGVGAVEREYVLAYTIHGIVSVVQTWLRRGCKEDEEYVAHLIVGLVPRPS